MVSRPSSSDNNGKIRISSQDGLKAEFSSQDSYSTIIHIERETATSPLRLSDDTQLSVETVTPRVDSQLDLDIMEVSSSDTTTSAVDSSSRASLTEDPSLQATPSNLSKAQKTENNTHTNMMSFRVSRGHNTSSRDESQVQSRSTSRTRKVSIHHLDTGLRVRLTRSGSSYNAMSRASSSVEGYRINPESPNAAFEHRVGFDTFVDKYGAMFAVTLKAKHTEYDFTQRSRVFMCGYIPGKQPSEAALEYLMTELAEDGDTIICVRVLSPTTKLSTSDKAVQEKKYLDTANKMAEDILHKNKLHKKFMVIVEFAIGDIKDVFERIIRIYEPCELIIGSSGDRQSERLKIFMPGSISKWCMTYLPIPVIVVKPMRKYEKERTRREKNPRKMSYPHHIRQRSRDSEVMIHEGLSTDPRHAPRIPWYFNPLANGYETPGFMSREASRDTGVTEEGSDDEKNDDEF